MPALSVILLKAYSLFETLLMHISRTIPKMWGVFQAWKETFTNSRTFPGFP